MTEMYPVLEKESEAYIKLMRKETDEPELTALFVVKRDAEMFASMQNSHYNATNFYVGEKVEIDVETDSD